MKKVAGMMERLLGGKLRLLSLLGACGLICSCSKMMEEQKGSDQTTPVEVCIAASSIQSRTEIEENGEVVRWSADDRIALWATDGESMPLEATPFSLWHFSHEYPTAYFTARIDPMPESTYTYCAAYPLPVAVDGTVAQFDLKSTQDGSKSLKEAVMVAYPVQAGALTNGADEEFHLSFSHKLHVLKITIPETKNLLGQPIHRIVLTFPVPVTGRLTTDVSDVNAPVTLSEGERELTLELAQPVNEGDVVFAVIAPVDASEGDISFCGYSESFESEVITTSGKNFLPGHTTPIRLTIPTRRKITRIGFTIDENHLGEVPEQITLQVQEGTFPDGSTTKSFAYNAENYYEVAYEGTYSDQISGKRVTVTYESKSAIVSETITMPTVAPYEKNRPISITVPYLFFEDFSQLKSFSKSDSYAGKGDDDRNVDGMLLNDYMPQAGWNVARAGGEAGKCVRIHVRYQSGAWIVGRYAGRLDTPNMAGLKPGVSANLQVHYDMACYVPNGYNRDDRSNNVTMLYVGSHTNDIGSVMNGVSNESDISGQCTVAAQTEYFGNTNSSGSYTPSFTTRSFQVGQATNASRLVWFPWTSRNSSVIAANAAYYVYIDNIKVSIAQ